MKKLLFIFTALAFMATAHATTFTENFNGNPLTNGWRIFGDTNLFQWDSTNHDLAVTWDSSQSNSYFYRPLGMTLTTNTDFGLDFDITINDATNANSTFQLALGFLNFADATNADFLRGTGYSTTDLVEFDFFMDPMYGNSISATENDTNGLFADVYDFTVWDTNTTYHVSLSHFAGDALISAELSVSNQYVSFMSYAYLETNFGDFKIDTLAIPSYSDKDAYGGATLLAHGTVANVVFTTTPNPTRGMTGQLQQGAWQAQFLTFSNWTYTVERSADLHLWTPIAGSTNGTGAVVTIPDTNAPADKAFYRVHARR